MTSLKANSNYYAEWESTGSCYHAQAKVETIYWISVPMVHTLIAVAAKPISIIGYKDQEVTHDCIEVHLECSECVAKTIYVAVEYTSAGKSFRFGKYNKNSHWMSHWKRYPLNFTLGDLRKAVNDLHVHQYNLRTWNCKTFCEKFTQKLEKDAEMGTDGVVITAVAVIGGALLLVGLAALFIVAAGSKDDDDDDDDEKA